MADPRWGIVATIKAPAREILTFVAHHLSLGADRIYIYLDNPNEEAELLLASHPLVDVTRTDQPYWKDLNGKRPPKHQLRQTRNATHAYHRAADLDWLIHIDVDEFLSPDTAVTSSLAGLPSDAQAARVRPAEVLSTDGVRGLENHITYCKAWMPPRGNRLELSKEIYPTYGQYIRGGFLSHIAGKLFVRTGIPDLEFRIHNAYVNETELPANTDMTDICLCHFHATKWGKWQRSFEYRLEKGSYRSEMRPAVSRDDGGLSLHELFNMIHDHEGEQGLRNFFTEVCVATDDLRRKLSEHGLLREFRLHFSQSLKKHFPQYTG
jgi:hypothetical protein